MLNLTPKSITASSGLRASAASGVSAGPRALHHHGSAHVTRSASAKPSMLGLERAFSISASASRSSADRQPRITPRSRRWRVSARVSIPQMPGTPRCSSKS